MKPFRFAVLLAINLLALSSAAVGQLSVLSSGDPNSQWKATQLQLIEQQLSDQAVKGPLRKELEAQKQWLSQWNSGELKDGPWMQQREAASRTPEPIIDPDQTATALRDKLLGKSSKPTAKETTELQALLVKHPEDVGVLQLYLHWIDQKQYRNDYAERIVETATKLATRLEAVEKQTDETRMARAYCYYRAARALIHMESPQMQAKQAIKDAQQHESQLLGLYNQLGELVGHDRPEFILIEVRMLRRDNWNGQALIMLEQNAEILDRSWYLAHRRDLLSDLGWSMPAKEAEAVAEAAKAGGPDKVR